MSDEYSEVELRREAMTLAIQSRVQPEELMGAAEEMYKFLTKRPGEPSSNEVEALKTSVSVLRNELHSLSILVTTRFANKAS